MNILQAKETIIRAGKELIEIGFLSRTFGNISCRINSNHSGYPDGSFAITPSGKNYLKISADEIVEMSLTDYSHDKDARPSMEYRLHGEIYRMHPDANFVIYTTQTNASAVSAMGLNVIKLDKEYPGIGDFIICGEYGMSGSLRLYGHVAKALKESAGNAILMKNHGALIFGSSYEEALDTSKNLEEACAVYLRGIGVEPQGSGQCVPDKWNTNANLEKYMSVRETLPAYVEDFAQVFGPEIKILDSCTEKQYEDAVSRGQSLLVRGRGFLCSGDDCGVKARLIEKNTIAALAAIGVKPLDPLVSRLLNKKYMFMYSKLTQ